MMLRNCYVNKTRNDKITVSSIVTFSLGHRGRLLERDFFQYQVVCAREPASFWR